MSSSNNEKVPLKDEKQAMYLAKSLSVAASTVLDARNKSGLGADKVEMLQEVLKDLTENISKTIQERTYIRYASFV